MLQCNIKRSSDDGLFIVTDTNETVRDTEALAAWLSEHVLPQAHADEHVKDSLRMCSTSSSAGASCLSRRPRKRSRPIGSKPMGSMSVPCPTGLLHMRGKRRAHARPRYRSKSPAPVFITCPAIHFITRPRPSTALRQEELRRRPGTVPRSINLRGQL
jgi:hypothetical protein